MTRRPTADQYVDELLDRIAELLDRIAELEADLADAHHHIGLLEEERDGNDAGRWRACLQRLIDRSDRSHHAWEPHSFPNDYSRGWHDGHTTAISTVSLEAHRALDPAGMAKHDEDWMVASHGTDREWLERTGCCGHCGMAADLCDCTPDDPCQCGPHQVKPWPRECRTCHGTGRIEKR